MASAPISRSTCARRSWAIAADARRCSSRAIETAWDRPASSWATNGACGPCPTSFARCARCRAYSAPNCAWYARRIEPSRNQQSALNLARPVPNALMAAQDVDILGVDEMHVIDLQGLTGRGGDLDQDGGRGGECHAVDHQFDVLPLAGIRRRRGLAQRNPILGLVVAHGHRGPDDAGTPVGPNTETQGVRRLLGRRAVMRIDRLANDGTDVEGRVRVAGCLVTQGRAAIPGPAFQLLAIELSVFQGQAARVVAGAHLTRREERRIGAIAGHGGACEGERAQAKGEDGAADRGEQGHDISLC